MDSFTLVVSFILLWLLFQYQQNWLVLGIAILLILSMRNWSSVILVLVALFILFISQNSLNSMFPLALMIIVGIGLIFGVKQEEQQPEFYPPEMGGMGGLMG